ncbi:MAG: hypothetical protein WCD18_25835 [Thermosynechococcaceae cyanobacterium]
MLSRSLMIAACSAAMSLGLISAAMAIPATPILEVPEPTIPPPPPPPPPPPIPGSMPVTLQLTKFICHNADEDSWYSNGDEPYLFVAAVYADGNTIQIGNLSNATVRVQSPLKTHGNLGRSGVDAGDSFTIPTATGRFSRSILPIGGLPTSQGKAFSMVGLVVIAMDEDGTSTSAANAGRQAFVNVLQAELNQAVRSLTLPDEATLRAKIKAAMTKAIRQETLSGIPDFFGVVDPDDYIGAQFSMWSYQQIENAGSAGLPIDMTFQKSGVKYQITGTVKTP